MREGEERFSPHQDPPTLSIGSAASLAEGYAGPPSSKMLSDTEVWTRVLSNVR